MNWLLLKNSLLVSGLATLFSVAVGFAAALWLAGLTPRWRYGFLVVAATTLALPPFLSCNAWLHFLGLTGVWRSWLPLEIYSLKGAVLVLALMSWPISAVLVLGAWQRLEASQLECDPALKGSALIRWLLWPMGRRALGLAAVLTFVLALNNFAVPAILQVKVFPAEVWVSFNTNLDYWSALKMSWPMIVAPLMLQLAFGRQTISWPNLGERAFAPVFRRQLGPAWFYSGGGLAFLVSALSVGLPLTQLFATRQTWSEFAPALNAGLKACQHSFAFAAITATITLALGLLTWRWRIGSLLWLPFFAPGVLLGIGLIYALNRPMLVVFYQSIGLVVLALGIRYLGIGWNAVALAVRSVDADLTDAARLSGASSWQLWRQVHGPQLAPQLAAAWYVTYLLCLWDVETLVLIVPPGGETLALRVFNLLHYGHNAQVNALCLLLLLLAILPWLGWVGWRWIASILKTRGNIRPRPCPSSSSSSSSSKLVHVQIIEDEDEGRGRERLKQRLFAHPLQTCLLVFFLSGAALLLAGCAKKSSDLTPIQSHFFSSVQVIGTRGAGLGEFNKPRSVAVDTNDNFYVADLTGRVQKFSPAGVFLSSWQMPQTDQGKPKGMCRDTTGNIVVVEPHYSRVNHFSPDGKLAGQWGEHGTNAGQLAFPRAVAVNSRGVVFVSEYGLVERVQGFKPGEKKLRLSFGKAGGGPGDFNRAEGLGIDAADRIYVADSCNHRIQIFSPAGAWLRAYGQAGGGKGELSYPYDVRVDAGGLQFVCEFGNSRIQVFDPRDQPVEILGGAGGDPGQFNNPWSIALDSQGNLYVADSGNHRVQKFIRKSSRATLAARVGGALGSVTSVR